MPGRHPGLCVINREYQPQIRNKGQDRGRVCDREKDCVNVLDFLRRDLSNESHRMNPGAERSPSGLQCTIRNQETMCRRQRSGTPFPAIRFSCVVPSTDSPNAGMRPQHMRLSPDSPDVCWQSNVPQLFHTYSRTGWDAPTGMIW